MQYIAGSNRKNINNINSVSKLTSNKNIINIKAILDGLRKHAPKGNIVSALRVIDRNQWHEIRTVLMRSYRTDGEKAYNNAVIELKKEEVKV